MRFEYRPSFIRLFKSLKKKSPHSAKQVISALNQAEECLEKQKEIPLGLGLRKLRGNYWEIRSSLADRILFYWKGELIQWILLGNHDEIQKFLSRH